MKICFKKIDQILTQTIKMSHGGHEWIKSPDLSLKMVVVPN